MKFAITVLSIVSISRVCYCAVPLPVPVKNVNLTDNSAAELRPVGRASSSNSSKPTSSEDDDNPLRNMIGCLREDSMFKCFNERVGVLIKVWREALLNSVRRNGDQPLQVNQGLEKVIRNIGKAVYYGVSSFFTNFSMDDDDEGRANEDGAAATDQSGTALEERGHHKKKKVHKEIKKIIIKIIIAIALMILKIKAILGMIQSLIITKLLLTSIIFMISHIFKLWYELKQAKLHKDDKSVIYYDNVHHDHTYDPSEHTEYEDHPPSSWGSLWGRSYAPTQPTPITSSAAFQSMYRKPWPYYAKAKPLSIGSDEEEYS